MGLRWLSLLMGILASALFAILGVGAIIGLLIAVSPANSIQDVQSLRYYSFMTSVIIGLGCTWGAFVVLRNQSINQALHGFLIGVGVGILYFLVEPLTFVGALLTLLLAVTGGVVGARMAHLNPRSEKA